jgi:hypothetical protein
MNGTAMDPNESEPAALTPDERLARLRHLFGAWGDVDAGTLKAYISEGRALDTRAPFDLSMVLLTRNATHFSRIPGLAINQIPVGKEE